MNPTITVKIKTNNPTLGDEIEQIVIASSGFRLQQPGDSERPDLLIHELGANPDEEFKLIQSLLEAKAVAEVFVTSDKKDADLLLKAMRAGAKEFLAQPLDEAEVKAALISCSRRMAQAAEATVCVHAGRIINVMGAKGGVGTTTVAVNLAMILAEQKKAGSVALVDLNTVFGEIPLFLSLTPTYHWGQITKNVSRLDPTFLLNAMARHPSGVYVLPSPSYLNGHPPATADVMDRLLSTMQRTFDFIIVDGGQSLDGPALKALAMADRIFLITLLNLPCLRNTGNLLKSLAGLAPPDDDRVRLVVNRHLKKSDITLKEAEESLRSRILWSIPNDYQTTMSAINRGKPIYEISPRSDITRRLGEIAESIIQGDPPAEKTVKKGWFFKK
jgi:pilus assembly protein CpaE